MAVLMPEIPVRRPLSGGSESSITFDDSSDSASTTDTVTNKNDDTLASSRSKLIRGKGLSPGDSGRLVDVRPKMDITDGSFLNLQVESGYRGTTSESRVDLESSGRTPGGSSGSQTHSDVHFGSDVDLAGRAPVTGSAIGRAVSSHRPTTQPPKQMDKMLISALLAALFIVAVAIGFFLARATS